MGLFGNKSQSQEEPLYENSYMGFWIKVYSNRVDFKAGVGSQSIPINQIGSVEIPMMGIMKITLITSGGQKYAIPCTKKKEVQQAIYDAQAHSNGNSSPTSNTEEITKLHELKEKGIITQEEFDTKKKQLLGV